MKTKLGSELSQLQQAYVKAAFVHRFTKEHKPAWAKEPWKGGKPYPVQFASDADWLAHTRFAVSGAGSLNLKSQFCESSPTWPDNPELRNP